MVPAGRESPPGCPKSDFEPRKAVLQLTPKPMILEDYPMVSMGFSFLATLESAGVGYRFDEAE